MLGMLALTGLIGGAYFATPAFAQPVNAATAANSDDDSVTQSNAATVSQSADTTCTASVDDRDGIQSGDNTNDASNDCDTTQSSAISQSNTNTDNDVQTAVATACQSIAGLLGAANSICDNS